MTNPLFDALTAAPEAALWLENHDGRRFTYGDLKALSGRLASALLDDGVEAGDRVAVQVEKSPEAIALYLATVRIGAVFLPLNTAYTPAEVAYFLGDAEPRLFVTSPEKLQSAESVAAEAGAALASLGTDGRSGSLMQKALGLAPMAGAAQRAPEDLAAILYTSGTTGRSKGAMLTHGNLLSNSLILKDYWRFTERDVLIHALPVYHTHGLFVAVNILALAGGSLIFMPKFEAAAVLAALPRATSLMGVPTFYTRLAQEPGFNKETTAGIRLLISGSAPLLAETHAQVFEKTGHAVLERYGMTETNMNTSNPYEGERRAGTVGFPLPGVSLRVVDPDTGRPLKAGEVGMIEVKGPNVFKGYWRQPEKTASEHRADGFFITGDLGVIDPDGYVSIVGRGKDLIITGGLNVYPKEVEGEIDALDGVIESAVIGLAHPDLGEAVTAVVAIGQARPPSEESILKPLETRLAAFKRPKRVLFVSDLPRNTMGKVQKALLRQTYAELFKA